MQELEKKLFKAIEDGKVDEIERLIDKKGADVNAVSDSLDTPLYVATKKGDQAAIAVLLKKPQLNRRLPNNIRALTWAAAKGNLDIVKQLVDIGGFNENARNNLGTTSLHEAINHGHVDIAVYLLEKKIIPDLKNDVGCTALHDATEKGYLNIVESLLKLNFNVNEKNTWGCTPLHLAASNGHADIVAHLLKVPGVDLTLGDERGRTALHHAAEKGNLDILEHLITAGCTVNAQDRFEATPLHKAAALGRIKVVLRLLTVPGIETNIKNKVGETALEIARRKVGGTQQNLPYTKIISVLESYNPTEKINAKEAEKEIDVVDDVPQQFLISDASQGRSNQTQAPTLLGVQEEVESDVDLVDKSKNPKLSQTI